MSNTITEKCNGCGACARICPAAAISGEKKKLYIIAADLCIECGACGRICPQSAILDAAGSVCLQVKKAEWLKPDIDLKTCVACAICIDTCPVGCLALVAMPGNNGADAYPYLKDAKACIGCGFCSRECPVEAITMQKPVNSVRATGAL
jgi:Na+-translocating ferredoxin:NAD+ oxidoreductase subunit B